MSVNLSLKGSENLREGGGEVELEITETQFDNFKAGEGTDDEEISEGEFEKLLADNFNLEEGAADFLAASVFDNLEWSEVSFGKLTEAILDSGTIDISDAAEDKEESEASIPQDTELGDYDNSLDLTQYGVGDIEDLTLEDLENFNFPSGSEEGGYHGYFTIDGTQYELWNNHGNFRFGAVGDGSSVSERVLLEDPDKTPDTYPDEDDVLTARVYSAEYGGNTVNVFQGSDGPYLLDDDGNVGKKVEADGDGKVKDI